MASYRNPARWKKCSENEVHLWKAILDVGAVQLSAFERTLSSEELARAARFLSQIHRDHFVASRGILRSILAHYLDKNPYELLFQYGRYGKPALEQTASEGTDIRFNVAHSAGLLLIVVSVGRELGVDLEKIQPAFLNKEIVEEVFSKEEQADYHTVREPMRVKRFFDAWTRKEAFLKALGVGLSVPLCRIEVLKETNVCLIRIKSDKETRKSNWTIFPLEINHGYSACLVVEGHGWKLKCFDFDE